MQGGINRRLINDKTRAEIGFDFVISKLSILTPMGRTSQKNSSPFYPGEEDLLAIELDKVEALKKLAETDPGVVNKIREIFHCLKDISRSIERAGTDALTEVEIYEIKSLLLYGENLRGILMEASSVPEEFIPLDITELLDVLDPVGDRINTFYIYDEYSGDLKYFRTKKKELDVEIRKLQKDGVGEGSEARTLIEERDNLNLKIEEEEDRVRRELSDKIGEYKEELLTNLSKIGRLDYVLAKAEFGTKYKCVRPEIASGHHIEIVNGRHLTAEEALNKRNKEYVPISMELHQGVTCITGANMGGKTISLKLAGLIPVMVQYGFLVPCEEAKVGLSNYIRILIGDSQSLERGLSTFGSEMEELKEIMQQAGDRSLVLIDEIASGTNPVEGLALTKSIVSHLKDKPYISLLTTHYETVTNDSEIRNLQVVGLKDADFRKLNSELSVAGKKERIDVIGRYMDYRLMEVTPGAEIPKDAINIARMLGLPEEIIEQAMDFMEGELK